MLTESVLLSLGGALVGIVAARVTLGALVRLIPGYVPRVAQVALNPSVLVATIAAACLAGFLAGLMPALQLAAPGISKPPALGQPTDMSMPRSCRRRP